MKLIPLAVAVALFAVPLITPSQAQQVAPLPTPLKATVVTVLITGEVSVPSVYQVPVGSSAIALFALAGGATDAAVLTKVTVTRRDGKTLALNLLDAFKTPNAKTGFAFQDGDHVKVPRNENRVLVAGAVKNPGYYTIPEGGTLSVAEALERAGGVILGGDLTDVLRPVQKNLEAGQPLPPRSLEAVKPDQLLQNGDIIIVPQKNLRNPENPANPPRGVAKFQFLKSGSASR